MYEDWAGPHLFSSEPESGVPDMISTIPLVALFFYMILHSSTVFITPKTVQLEVLLYPYRVRTRKILKVTVLLW